MDCGGIYFCVYKIAFQCKALFTKWAFYLKTSMSKAPRENKTGVFIFRLPTSQSDKLKKQFEERPIVGITSENLFARKIILDYLSGRLIYLNPELRKDNPLLSQPAPSNAR
jgi:hypothetical protein